MRDERYSFRSLAMLIASVSQQCWSQMYRIQVEFLGTFAYHMEFVANWALEKTIDMDMMEALVGRTDLIDLGACLVTCNL